MKQILLKYSTIYKIYYYFNIKMDIFDLPYDFPQVSHEIPIHNTLIFVFLPLLASSERKQAFFQIS